MSGNLADPNAVFPGTSIQVAVADAQQYNVNPPGYDVTLIQLNWTASTAALNLATASTWTWHSDITGFANVPYNDPNMTDERVDPDYDPVLGPGIVRRTAYNENPVTHNLVGIQAPQFTIGTLQFAAPAYNSGGGNTYTMSLAGGSFDDETLTALCAGLGGLDTQLYVGNGLTIGTYQFTVAAAGTWLGGTTAFNTPGNWSSNMAPVPAFTATFDAGAPNQPALTQAESVKQIHFLTYSWTISGGANVLTVGDGGIVSTPATDSNAISAAVTAGASANWTINNTVTLSGTLNLAGKTITKDGGGTLTVSGTQNHAASSVLNANAGNVVFNTDAGGTAHNKNLTVNVNGNAAVALNSTEYLAGLNVNTGSATLAAGGTNILVTNALTVDTTDSALDITNNRLIVDYAPAEANPSQQIQNLIRSGYNKTGGYWDGNGIFSSHARDDEILLTAVGVLDNSDELVGGKATFGGVTVDASSVLVKYTYWGDANLDGQITFDDYDIIDYYYWFPLPADQAGWWTGDFNMDGEVTFDDYDLIDYAYWFQGAPLSGDGLTAVPEPATMTLLAMGLGSMLLRRRRSR